MKEKAAFFATLLISFQTLALDSIDWHYSKCMAFNSIRNSKGEMQIKPSTEPIATGHIDVGTEKLVLNYDLNHGSTGAIVQAQYTGKDGTGTGQFKTLSSAHSPDIFVSESAMKGRGGLILVKPEQSTSLLFDCQKHEDR